MPQFKTILSVLALSLGCAFAASDDSRVCVEFSDPSAWIAGGANYGKATRVEKSDERTPDGDASLLFHYELRYAPGKLTYAQYKRVTPVATRESVTQATLWVKGDEQQHPLQLRFFNARDYHQWAGPSITWHGWKKITIELKPGLPGYNTWRRGDAKPLDTPAARKLVLESITIDRRADGDEDTGAIHLGKLIIE